jgi:serine/threonine protein kinase
MLMKKRYILFKKIASGGMAEIYLGKQIGEDGFQRLCCIKRILPHYASNPNFVNMFRDEAHINKKLHHANIVKIEGFEEVESSYALIMEFVNGCDLGTILKACLAEDRQLSIPMIVYIIAEAAKGLHFVHKSKDYETGKDLGIVHRDISPQNILISFEGEVKVTDFGIADAESKLVETRTGAVKGKYSYMSPEQIGGESVDLKTDIFALGVVLWESLTMKRLFTGDSDVETIQNVSNRIIKNNIKDINELVDNNLEKIILKCLEKDASLRYNSALSLEKDLRLYLNKISPDFNTQDLSLFIKAILSDKLSLYAGMMRDALSSKEKEEKLSFDVEKTQAITKKIPINNKKKKIVNFALKSELLIVLGVVLSLVFVGAKEIFLNKGYYQLNIDGHPEHVQISIDGRKVLKGREIKTPIRIDNLSEGYHKVLVGRNGFKSKHFDLFGKDKEQVNIDNYKLQRIHNFYTLKINMIAKTVKQAYFIVGSGKFYGRLAKGSLTSLAHLVPGESYDIRFFLNYYNKKKNFGCRIKLPENSKKNSFVMNVNMQKKHCYYSNS